MTLNFTARSGMRVGLGLSGVVNIQPCPTGSFGAGGTAECIQPGLGPKYNLGCFASRKYYSIFLFFNINNWIWPRLNGVRWCHLIPQPVCGGGGGSRSGSACPPGVVTAAQHLEQAALELEREETGYVLGKEPGVCLETWRQRLWVGAPCILGEICINSQPNSSQILAVY